METYYFAWFEAFWTVCIFRTTFKNWLFCLKLIAADFGYCNVHGRQIIELTRQRLLWMLLLLARQNWRPLLFLRWCILLDRFVFLDVANAKLLGRKEGKKCRKVCPKCKLHWSLMVGNGNQPKQTTKNKANRQNTKTKRSTQPSGYQAVTDLLTKFFSIILINSPCWTRHKISQKGMLKWCERRCCKIETWILDRHLDQIGQRCLSAWSLVPACCTCSVFIRPSCAEPWWVSQNQGLVRMLPFSFAPSQVTNNKN